MHRVATAALANGIDFLRAGQGADGLWRDFLTPAGEASTWPTAYIGHALQRAGAAAGAPLERASKALALLQQPDGGWGYHEGTPSDADSTSWAVLLLTHVAGYERACQRAYSYLARCQRLSGGVATYAEAGPIRRYVGMSRWVPFRGWCSPQTEVSAVAGRAHCALGSDVSRVRAVAAWQYVRSRQNSDGSWSSYWWTSPHFATEQAVALAVRMGDRQAVRRATAWALSGQRRDGGWSTPGEAASSSFVTALGVSVLSAAGVDVSRAIAGGVDALVRLQQADGGWPGQAVLRVPTPADPRPAGDDRWHLVRFDAGIVAHDQHRTFTSGACVAALARALQATA